MINLLPPEIKKEAYYNSSQKELVVYGVSLVLFGIVAIGIQLLGYVYVNQQKSSLRTDLDARQSQLEEINKSQSDAVELSRNIKKVGALLDKEVDFSRLILEIGAVLPSSTTINSLALGIDNSQPITLQFDIDTQEKAAIVRKNLEDSLVFTGADIQSITIRETNEDGDATGFTTSIVTKFSEEYLRGELDDIEDTGSNNQTGNQTADNQQSDETALPAETTSSEITLTAADASGGFLFFKSNKVKLDWAVPSTIAEGQDLQYTILASKSADVSESSSTTESIILPSSAGSIEFELRNEVPGYNFKLCATNPLLTSVGCIVTSETISI